MNTEDSETSEEGNDTPKWMGEALAEARSAYANLQDDDDDDDEPEPSLAPAALAKQAEHFARMADRPEPRHRPPGKPVWQLWAERFAHREMHARWRPRGADHATRKADLLALEQALGYTLGGGHPEWQQIGLGHCAGTDYAWNEEYRMWLPGPDLQRRGFLAYLDARRAQERELGRDATFSLDGHLRELPTPEELTPTFVAQVVDHARLLLTLSPADVDPSPAPRLLLPDAVDTIPAQHWCARIHGAPFLPAGGIGSLGGKFAALKSHFAVQLSAAIATDRDLAGLTLACPPGAYVVYVGAENAEDLGRRLSFATAGAPARRFALFDQPVPVTDGEAVLGLIRQMRTTLPPGAPVALIVLDTFNQTLGAGDDENSADTVRNYTIGMRLLARATGATVMTVAHPGHVGDRPRGSSAFEANADFSYWCEREEGELRVAISCRKLKSAETPKPFTATFTACERGLTLTNIEAGKAAKAETGDAFTAGERDVFDVFIEHGGPMAMAEWKEAAIEELEVSEALVRNTRSAAAAANLIQKAPGRRWALTSAGHAYAAAQGHSEIV